MVLTDKTKIEFEDFIYNKYEVQYNLNDYYTTMLLAEIIEFFDSKGIYIEINTQFNDEEELRFTSNIFSGGDYIHYESCDSRQKAIEQAILKAQEIYENR